MRSLEADRRFRVAAAGRFQSREESGRPTVRMLREPELFTDTQHNQTGTRSRVRVVVFREETKVLINARRIYTQGEEPLSVRLWDE